MTTTSRSRWTRAAAATVAGAALALCAVAPEARASDPAKGARTIRLRSAFLFPGDTDSAWFDVPEGTRTIRYSLSGGGRYPGAGVFGPEFSMTTVFGRRPVTRRNPDPGEYEVLFTSNALTRGRITLTVRMK